ncbi:MAG: PrgI family protein [bacterium]
MSAKIPQNVTKEDRIVGPLTLKQFLYALGGGLLIFIAYRYYALQYLYFIEFTIISFVIASFTLALAFAQINGRPFGVFLLTAFHFLNTPKTRNWHKEPLQEVAPIKVKAIDIKNTRAEMEERQAGKRVKMQIEQLAHVLDTGGTMNQDNDDIVTVQTSHLSKTAPQFSGADTGVEDLWKDLD